MIRYVDGIGVHRDLHTKKKTFKRRTDLDERYRQNESMKCFFEKEDEKCMCYRCRTEKWPGLYAAWELTESKVELVKSIAPSRRQEWAEDRVIGEHLFAKQ